MPFYHLRRLRLINQIFSTLLLCLLLSNVSGCGKKGPLYLPDDSQPSAPPTATESAPDSSTTQDTP